MKIEKEKNIINVFKKDTNQTVCVITCKDQRALPKQELLECIRLYLSEYYSNSEIKIINEFHDYVDIKLKIENKIMLLSYNIVTSITL